MNPILDFGIDKSTLQYVGRDLQRPECILAEPDGVLWSADARGGVMRIAPDGTQTNIVSGSPLFAPGGIAVGTDGALYVTNRSTSPTVGEVLKIEL